MLLLSYTLLTPALTSCGSDETEGIGYYISVGSKGAIGGYISSDEKVYELSRAMQDSIRSVYPKPNAKGDDSAVLTVCNNLYHAFQSENPDYFTGHLVVNLYRGWMRDGVIKSSTLLMTWTI